MCEELARSTNFAVRSVYILHKLVDPIIFSRQLLYNHTDLTIKRLTNLKKGMSFTFRLWLVLKNSHKHEMITWVYTCFTTEAFILDTGKTFEKNVNHLLQQKYIAFITIIIKIKKPSCCLAHIIFI